MSISAREAIPPSTKRVKLHTNKKVNERIEQKTVETIRKYEDASREMLDERLRQLNKEWDTERVLEANAASLIFISTVLGYFFTPYWYILVAIVSFYLLQHAVQGWCPPLPVIRRLGIRTPEEISDEKTVIKFLRGDFKQVSSDPVELLKIMKQD